MGGRRKRLKCEHRDAALEQAGFADGFGVADNLDGLGAGELAHEGRDVEWDMAGGGETRDGTKRIPGTDGVNHYIIEWWAGCDVFYAIAPEGLVGATGQPRVAAAEMLGKRGELVTKIDFPAADREM